MAIEPIPLETKLKVASFVCPGFFALDVLGAHTVLSSSPNVQLDMVWKTLDPVEGVSGITVVPTMTFDKCVDLDVLIVGFIPGTAIDDPEVISFVKKIFPKTKIILSICGGTHLFAALGLLKGIKATSNLAMVDSLADYGAIPVKTTGVVVDGKFFSAGPASGSIEAGIMALAALRGEGFAKFAELGMEYDPHSIYGVGNVATAPAELVTQVRAALDVMTESAREATAKVYGAQEVQKV